MHKSETVDLLSDMTFIDVAAMFVQEVAFAEMPDVKKTIFFSRIVLKQQFSWIHIFWIVIYDVSFA